MARTRSRRRRNPIYLIQRPDGDFDVAYSTLSDPNLGFQILKPGLPRSEAEDLARMLSGRWDEPVKAISDRGIEAVISGRPRYGTRGWAQRGPMLPHNPATPSVDRLPAPRRSRRVSNRRRSRRPRRNPQLMVVANPYDAKVNPQLMVVTNPSAIPGVNSRAVKKAEKAYKRFHMTKPAQMLEGWVPSGWPKTYITIGECLRYDVVGADGKKFKKSFKKGHRPALCTTPECKEVFLFGDLAEFPSGQALRVDYRVPAHSGRAKWARDWTHDHDSRPDSKTHSSGKAIRISGKKLIVTPRGIEH